MVNTVKPIGMLLLLSGLPLGLASAAPELTLVKIGEGKCNTTRLRL